MFLCSFVIQKENSFFIVELQNQFAYEFCSAIFNISYFFAKAGNSVFRLSMLSFGVVNSISKLPFAGFKYLVIFVSEILAGKKTISSGHLYS